MNVALENPCLLIQNKWNQKWITSIKYDINHILKILILLVSISKNRPQSI